MRTVSAATLRTVLRECSRRERIDAFLRDLEAGTVEWLLHDWELWARDDQLPPEGAWTSWILLGGRGAGKTRAGAEWVRTIALADGQTRIALIGETLGDARAVMVEGVSGLLSVHTGRERPNFEPSKKQITWRNGSIAQLLRSHRRSFQRVGHVPARGRQR
jgi:phage terminase large subunit-like protein